MMGDRGRGARKETGVAIRFRVRGPRSHADALRTCLHRKQPLEGSSRPGACRGEVSGEVCGGGAGEVLGEDEGGEEEGVCACGAVT